VYGPEGPWVELFRRGAGYRSTRLLRTESVGRYLTLDEWQSQAHYESFRRALAGDYEALDRRCEHLTLSEKRLLVIDGEEVG
jgi:heme-degrading monooxygenase HmoA